MKKLYWDKLYINISEGNKHETLSFNGYNSFECVEDEIKRVIKFKSLDYLLLGNEAILNIQKDMFMNCQIKVDFEFKKSSEITDRREFYAKSIKSKLELKTDYLQYISYEIKY